MKLGLFYAAIALLFTACSSTPSATATPRPPTSTPTPKPTATPIPTPTPLLELLPGWGCTKEYSHIIFEGQVKNMSNMPLKNVVALTTYYTDDGTFVKTAQALIAYDPILPGQTSPFKTITSDNPAIIECSVDFKYLGGGSIPTKRTK